MKGQKEKQEDLLTRIKDCFYGLFDQLVTSNLCNSPAIILCIALETLIYIHVLYFQSSAFDSTIDSLYSSLQYLNVHLLTHTCHNYSPPACC